MGNLRKQKFDGGSFLAISTEMNLTETLSIPDKLIGPIGIRFKEISL